MSRNLQIILASGSPRRRELLELLGIKFTIMTSDKEENMRNINPCELVRELSAVKAQDVAQRAPDMSVIIGADTVVAYGSKVLGKPKSEDEAFAMLKELQNNVHEVHTGVCIIVKEDGQTQQYSFDVTTKVYMTEVTDEQIRAYIATGEPMDKAGAYAIQGKFAPYIKSIEGDYYNIVGFPISSIYHKLLEIGVEL